VLRRSPFSILGDDAANGSRPVNPSYLVSLLIVAGVQQCRQLMQSQIATEPQHSVVLSV
jgi:hypothetical protein